MLEKSFGLLFFLKQSKNQKAKEKYVYLRITVNGVSKELSTKRTWVAERWMQSTGRAAGNKEDARSLNAFLDALSAKVYSARTTLIESNKEISASALRDVLTGHSNESKLLLETFQRHNDQMSALVGLEYAPGTYKRYQTAYDHAKRFIQWKYKEDDIDILKLNYEFVSDYAFYLKSVRNCGHNSTVKYISNLKKVVLQCIKRGWLKADPFVEFKTTKKEVVRTALTNVELSKIEDKTFICERLTQVRDIFLFSCYTGLAYIDVKNLTRQQIVMGDDGEDWIITKRQKTESPTRLPLLPVAKKMISLYETHFKCMSQNSVFPILSNQKMNAYLKEIGDVCGINKNLTFHLARHTFATTITLNNDVPLETVSKMLGHKSLKQTQLYAKILDTKVSSDMRKLKAKLDQDIHPTL